ncbi:MAG: hypothetical protein A4E57_03184 [Syntrophorhabdaceae bacterium PtaU1.Bin034]|nr:MAG: hypothetical protein A4E57_03184 [Syntrophorhabdaceae bacterium PtaU1.Bin034]
MKKADLPLEVVILLIAGLIMLITGIFLFPVSAGALPYYENGLYGLLLVMFALQIITLGKTPFGDMGKSKLLLAVGVVIAAVGIVTCFVPDILVQLPRILLFLCFGPGGLALLLQMCFARDKLRAWLKYGGIFPRSWLMIAFGLLFAALGIVSCIIPGVLVLQLTVLVGVLNILGGVITLGKLCIPRLGKSEEPGLASVVLSRLFGAQLIMNLLTILFGASMLVSNLIPGLVIGVVLAANGCVLLYLLSILIALGKMEGDVASAT